MAMFIGVPKEIKADEYRVGLIPSIICKLVAQGHEVAVELALAKARASVMTSTLPLAPASLQLRMRSSSSPS
jgi:NAD/NADP transhydrogenase alpha subunit